METVTREAKTLEFNLNKHLRQKYKTTERKSFINTKSTDIEYIDNMINNEISVNKQKHKSWNALNTCDKWKLIKEFYAAKQHMYDEKITKKLLLTDKLTIKYDNVNNKILSINDISL